jgi:transcription-repair coupling factor (superfamily II helicase)
LLKLNEEVEAFPQARDALERGSGHVQVEGLSGSAKAFVLAGLFRQLDRPIMVITASSEQVERLADDLTQFGLSDAELFLVPPSDSLIYEEGAPDFRVIGQRLASLHALASGQKAVVVAPVNGALRRTMPPGLLVQSSLEVVVGQTLVMDDFVRRLIDLGYERAEICEGHGEFSQRGGIIDVYASNEGDPVRIELFGDEVESIRTFEPASQRSTGHRKRVTILPARELVLTRESADAAVTALQAELKEQLGRFHDSGRHEEAARLQQKVEDDITRISNLAYFDGVEAYLPYIHPQELSVLDYLPESTMVVLDELGQMASSGSSLSRR